MSTVNLEAKRAALALARQQYEARRAELDAARAAFEADHAELIAEVDSLKEAEAAADAALRDETLKVYAADLDNKKPIDGVEVKLWDVMDFDKAEAETWRTAAWDVIRATPHHTWQILTKRPERVAASLPEDWASGWPQVWLGVSVESQAAAQARLPVLTALPAAVRFVSSEPLLGPVDLRAWLPDLDWVIAGGESGPRHRPMAMAWARDLRDQCAAAGVPFFFKQDSDLHPERRPYLVERDGRRTVCQQFPGDVVRDLAGCEREYWFYGVSVGEVGRKLRVFLAAADARDPRHLIYRGQDGQWHGAAHVRAVCHDELRALRERVQGGHTGHGGQFGMVSREGGRLDGRGTASAV